MGFLRKLFGGGDSSPDDPATTSGPPATQQQLDEDERHYERELALFEQQRLDELKQRQLRYADRSWTPDAQGGPQRSDDAERAKAGSDRD